MVIKNIGFCGLGTVGAWIAQETKAAGYTNYIYDPNLSSSNQNSLGIFCNSLKEVVEFSNLIIESIPEDVKVKKDFYQEVDRYLTGDQILTSNTSFMLPQDFLPESFSNKQSFSCLHFYLPKTAVDIMPISETSPGVVAMLEKFVISLGEEPVLIRKPTRGYLVGLMAGAAADAALSLLHDEVASAEMIDTSWKKITGMQKGPLEIMDEVGLDTSLKIRKVKSRSDDNQLILEKAMNILERYVSKGHLGKKTKKGFYDY